MAENTTINLSEQEQIRRDKLASLQADGKNPYAITKFHQTDYSQALKAEFEALAPEAEADKVASVAGRLMSKRVMGKASFAHLRDNEGEIQLYVTRDNLGEEEYAAFKKLDIGDIIGAEGVVFRTKTGELSVKVTKLQLLSKSLKVLPEKFHGLTDQELRYRQRYVDLIVNPEVKDTFKKRSQIMSEIRAYLDEKGYLEVETPILTPFEIGASARPFLTHHNTLDMDMVLRIETELYLKRLIVGGIDRVYEIGRIFRNEGMDPRHNPEFTSIELYQAYTDFHGMMDLTEELFKRLADKVCGTRQISYQGTPIDLDNWTRMSMTEAVKKYSGIDFDEIKTTEEAVELAKKHNVPMPEGEVTKGSLLPEFFDAFVEDKLIQPTFIYEYPVEISPLTKRCPDKPDFTERFEFFINGTEFGNAYSELNDPIDQRGRFERQVAERKKLEPNCHAQVDYDFVNALEYGMPPTGGLGIGIDRTIMLLTDSASIRDVLLFPTMRPEVQKDNSAASVKDDGKCCPEEGISCCCDGEASTGFFPGCKCPECPSAEACKAAFAQNAGKSFDACPNCGYKDEKIDFSKVEIEPLFADFVDFDTFAKSDFRAVKVLACEAVPKSKKLLRFTLNDGTGTERTILSGIHAFYEPEELVGKTLIAITNLPPRAMMGIESCGMLLSAIHNEEGEEKLHLLMVDNHIPAGAKLY